MGSPSVHVCKSVYRGGDAGRLLSALSLSGSRTLLCANLLSDLSRPSELNASWPKLQQLWGEVRIAPRDVCDEGAKASIIHLPFTWRSSSSR